ncbi:TetR/AcrR family transcriptional regulator [Streptosporangium sp. NPDC002524]|uniref:TetR/AcrR family transcriptional regulator n=1 Tax=Streptosporangium sp. NPDC002524 TaxID=3154537 RepID=UPI00332C3A59
MKPTRVRILDAADQLMRTIGLARTTTKEIARVAGCSEAALYKHFDSKEELFTFVLKERLPRLAPLLAELESGNGGVGRDGDGRDVEETLAEIARHAVAFYASTFPIAASLFSDPALLRRHGEEMDRLDMGPHKPLDALAAYLREQRAAGRLRTGADPEAAAALFLGACFQRAFLHAFAGERPPSGPAAQPLDEFAAALARTLLEGVREPEAPVRP